MGQLDIMDHDLSPPSYDSGTTIHSGKLLHQSQSILELRGWMELYATLSAESLTIMKLEKKDGMTREQPWRRPILLELISSVNCSEPPVRRNNRSNSGFSSPGHSPQRQLSLNLGEKHAGTQDTAIFSRMLFPITIRYTGRSSDLLTVYTESPQSRDEWQQKLAEAMNLRKTVQDCNKVVELVSLGVPSVSEQTAGSLSTEGSWDQVAASSESSTPLGRITCSVPFTTPAGIDLFAFGCNEGVWFCRRDTASSLKQVIHLKLVTQCAVLDKHGIFLVMADKALYAYDIASLVPSNLVCLSTRPNGHYQKLSGDKDIDFFRVGCVSHRTMVIYGKRKNLDTIFYAFEPAIGTVGERTKEPTSVNLSSHKNDWFVLYKKFFLPTVAHDLISFKANVVVLHSRGYECVEVTKLKSTAIPVLQNPRLKHIARRCKSAKPIGMFRAGKDAFMLCYNEFGLRIDRHGEIDVDRSDTLIEWEGIADQVSFHAPYIILFNAHFIEIRHIETGHLCQILPGNMIRVICDGRAWPSPPPSYDKYEPMQQESQIHVVMDPAGASSSATPSRQRSQQAFKLISVHTVAPPPARI